MEQQDVTTNDKVILDLCGGTGAWSEPYKKAGYTVLLITLPQYDVTHTYPFNGLATNSLKEGNFKNLHFAGPNESLNIHIDNVHGILAAPPCTMFSRARTTAKTPRDFKEAMRVVNSCLEIIWYCRTHGNLKWWALENPMGYLRQFLGNPPHSFRGWEFGDDHVKFTDLWGYFTMPVGRFKQPKRFNAKRYASPKKPAKYKHLTLDRAAIRAITPEGFAQAFFRVNQ